MSTRSKLVGLYRTSRIEITIAFVVPVVMLGIACAVATGQPLAWMNLLPGAGMILCLILLSNTLNNYIDVDVDKRAMEQGNRKSGMYHTPNVPQSLWDVVGCVVGVLLFSWWLVIETGAVVLVFITFGSIMALDYNLPPLKLAYRPFSELTMLLPSTIVAVAGLQYILVGQVTALAMVVSAAFGLFSASWFVFQSMIDYEVDKEAGKVTTPVHLGLVVGTVVGVLYSMLGAAVLDVGYLCNLPVFLPTLVGCACACCTCTMLTRYGTNSFKMWQITMLVALIFGVATAIIIMR